MNLSPILLLAAAGLLGTLLVIARLTADPLVVRSNRSSATGERSADRRRMQHA